MKTIAVITVGRSDYSIYLPILRLIQVDSDLNLQIVAGGMHLSPEFGSTIDVLTSDGFEIAETVDMLLSSDTQEAMAKSVGIGIVGFAEVYGRLRPDMILVLGDRLEMHAAAVAAVPFNIPIAHVHGGEITEGAIDDVLRHSMTKLSHLHFVSTIEYAKRVCQMGEESWRVIVSGSPSLDNLREIELWDFEELTARFDLSFEIPPILVTYHPVTLQFADTARQIAELLDSLKEYTNPILFTAPNADPGGRELAKTIKSFVEERPQCHFVPNLGTKGYFSMMAHAGVMVGNSSSGIIEAASFGLPVVNIGERQRGRVRPANVIDVACDRVSISSGIERGLSPEFKQSLKGLVNPYGQGRAASVIVDGLKKFSSEILLAKRFVDANL